jgi:hypothetical protein
MTLAAISKPQYPSIPKTSGAPNVNRPNAYVQVVDAIITAKEAVSELFSIFGSGAKFGIFDSNLNLVFSGDSTVSFEFRQEWRISDYPIEQGSFTSYNKVLTPFEVRMTFTVGGNVTNRNAALAVLLSLCNSLALYTVVTPEQTYGPVSISHIDYRKQATRGATLLQIDVWLTNINVSTLAVLSVTQQPDSSSNPTTPAVSDPQSPSASPTANGGTAGTDPMTVDQAQALPDPAAGQSTIAAESAAPTPAATGDVVNPDTGAAVPAPTAPAVPPTPAAPTPAPELGTSSSPITSTTPTYDLNGNWAFPAFGGT